MTKQAGGYKNAKQCVQNCHGLQAVDCSRLDMALAKIAGKKFKQALKSLKFV